MLDAVARRTGQFDEMEILSASGYIGSPLTLNFCRSASLAVQDQPHDSRRVLFFPNGRGLCHVAPNMAAA